MKFADEMGRNGPSWREFILNGENFTVSLKTTFGVQV